MSVPQAIILVMPDAWESSSDAEEIAWAAGFVDAEGCFSFTLPASYAAVNVGQTHREPLDRLVNALGAGKVRGPFSMLSPNRPSKKDQFCFYAYGSRALRIAEELWRFLSGPKRQQVLHLRECAFKFNPKVSRGLRPLGSQGFTTRRQELAWAAGFFEGDGCFSYSTSIRGVCAAILQRDREVLDHFLAIVGVGKVYGPYERPEGGLGGKPFFQYRAHGFEKTQAIVAMLWFKLGTAKRKQAIAVLAKRMRRCRRGHVLGTKHRGCPRCVAEAWARKRQVS